MLSTRKAFLFGVLITLGLLSTGLYMQYQMGLEPCPLCVLQRVAFMAVGLACFIGLLINRSWLHKLASLLILLFAGIGAVIAGRQVWLQSLPADQVPTCGPGFEYMVNNFPLAKAMSLIFSGSGECAEVQWTFLGLSIAGWSLIMFVGFVLLAAYLLIAKRSA